MKSSASELGLSLKSSVVSTIHLAWSLTNKIRAGLR